MEEQTLKFRLTPIAGAIAAALAPSHQVIAQDADFALEEIIVTATKRSLNIQDIPASVQALGQEALADMGARTAEDFARFMPGINVVSYGNSDSTVIFRGAATSSGYITPSTSSVYLDELALTSNGSQPSVRMVDIERVEALAGPQGTLYGSDAQAGTLRIITNKPKMNEFEAILDGEIRGGSTSDASYNGSLVFNLPVVEDKLALRIAAYADHDGGFIDNVLGYTADTNALTGTKYTQKYGTLNNAHAVEKNWNDEDTRGFRAKLQWDMNDNWTATFTGQMQSAKSVGGGNSHNPFVGKHQTVMFVDGHSKSNFKAYDLLIEADLGFADLVSSTNYYNYAASGVSDITDYAHYWSATYCADSGLYANAATYDTTDAAGTTYADAMPYYYANPKTGYLGYFPRYCAGTDIDSDFYSTSQSYDENSTVSQEFRLSSQGDNIDWIVGMYIQDSTNSWVANFAVPTDGKSDASLFQSSYSAAYYKHNFEARGIPNPTKATSSWYSEQATAWQQRAFFGEVAWRMTDNWTLTLGARNYSRDNESAYYVDHPGSSYSFGQDPYGVGDGGNGADAVDGVHRLANNGRPTNHKGNDKITIPKISLKYNLNDDTMVYALYTKGERPGGTNRSRGVPFFPNIYNPDVMTNTEAGFRSTFGDGRGRFNLTAYHMAWEKYQLELVDPSSTACDANGGVAAATGLEAATTVKTDKVCGQPWQNLVANIGDAHISGINIDIQYALTEAIQFGVNYERMEAQTDTDHSLDFATPDTLEIKKGMRLPMVPVNKGSIWATWSSPTNMSGADYKFVRFQASTQGGSFNKLEQDSLNSSANPQTHVPGYTLVDIKAGLQGENWELTAFVDNLMDEVATYTRSQGDYGWAQASSRSSAEGGRARNVNDWISRPREIGIRYMKRWGN
jgi:outer membrane receptor protein involved in Fe transport